MKNTGLLIIVYLIFQPCQGAGIVEKIRRFLMEPKDSIACYTAAGMTFFNKLELLTPESCIEKEISTFERSIQSRVGYFIPITRTGWYKHLFKKQINKVKNQGESIITKATNCLETPCQNYQIEWKVKEAISRFQSRAKKCGDPTFLAGPVDILLNRCKPKDNNYMDDMDDENYSNFFDGTTSIACYKTITLSLFNKLKILLDELNTGTTPVLHYSACESSIKHTINALQSINDEGDNSFLYDQVMESLLLRIENSITGLALCLNKRCEGSTGQKLKGIKSKFQKETDSCGDPYYLSGSWEYLMEKCDPRAKNVQKTPSASLQDQQSKKEETYLELLLDDLVEEKPIKQAYSPKRNT